MMRDELFIKEMSLRLTQEKMDEAFRAAMQRAIDAGEENTSTVVSKKPSTDKNPKIVLPYLPGPRRRSDSPSSRELLAHRPECQSVPLSKRETPFSANRARGMIDRQRFNQKSLHRSAMRSISSSRVANEVTRRARISSELSLRPVFVRA